MIVLDTNVVSELMRTAPDSGVVNCVDSFPASEVFVTAVTAAELLYGVARLPDSRRRRELHTMVGGLLAEDFRDRILPFDAVAATHYAELVSAGRFSAGSPWPS